MKYLVSIPLPAVLLVIYNIIMISGGAGARLAHPLFSIGLPSGASWAVTASDLLIMLGVVLLYFELIKSTRPSAASMVDHLLSLTVFAVYLVQFFVVTGCGNSTFLILGLIALIDVAAGFTIAVVAARRDLAISPQLP